MTPLPKISPKEMLERPFYPRLTRTDRFPTSCSILSAFCQLEQLGVDPSDIRLILEDPRRQRKPQIQGQSPAPGTPVAHGVEVQLNAALDGLVGRFPEKLFVSLPGEEGRQQLADTRRLFSPFDKAGLLALSRLRHWNTVFSMAHTNPDFEAFVFEILGLSEEELERARTIFGKDELQAWIRILPLLSRIIGNSDQITRVLKRFLSDTIELKIEGSHEQEIQADRSWRLTQTSGQTLGSMVLGSKFRHRGTTAVIMISGVTAHDFQNYAGVSWRPISTSSGEALEADLGPVCELDSHAAQWPRLVYLLQYLLPAMFGIRIRIHLASSVRWRLGVPEETPGHETTRLGVLSILGG